MSTDRLEAAKKKFSRLLKEIFRFDYADLDFGIYRILALRRHELEDFLDNDLLPQVEELLAGAAGDRQAVVDELAKLEDNLRAAGITDFSTSPKWQELKGRLAAQPDVAGLAREVFSDLTTFFSRYYDEGDFLALPRYKGDTYAIPYDGSEVKLHWANADQYYIKTTEQHADYRAELVAAPGLSKPVLLFKVAAAESDRDNNKSSEKRRYVLRAEDPVEVDDDSETLTAWFEYKVVNDSGRQPSQKSLCEEAEATILDEVPASWKTTLTRPAAQNDAYTQLGYQLYRYTKKNTSDYFIHKDLGGFLRRELDFFIKNEVLFLDDLEGRSTSDIEAALRKVRALRGVGGKIIAWLGQLEDFQRTLFTKKPLILGTDWVVTLDRIPRELRAEVEANTEQAQRWYELGLLRPGAPLHPHLPVETRFFDRDFTLRLLESQTEFDDNIEGTALNGTNFAALRCIGRRHEHRIDYAYLDPPFNTTEVGFIYKNEYRHSSWLSMMAQAVEASMRLLPKHGLMSIAIDDAEVFNLGSAMDSVVGESRRVGVLVVEIKPSGRTNDHFLSTSHEYYLWYAQDPSQASICYFDLSDDAAAAYSAEDGEGAYKWRDFLRTGGYSTPEERPNSYYPIYYRESDGYIGVEKVADAVEVLPLDSKGDKRVWRKTPPSFMEHVAVGDIKVEKGRGDVWKVRIKDRIKDGTRPKSVWVGSKYDASSHGTKLLSSMFGEKGAFPYPKSLHAVFDAVWVATKENPKATVLDYFAGSGTTGQAVVELNRLDDGQRKYVLVEMGEHFDAVLVPRLLKASFASKWKDGEPEEVDARSYMLRVCRIESYDDTLENVALQRDPKLGELFKNNDALREDYTLRYMLDLESRGSLLNLEKFRKPWDYTIKVRKDGVVQESPVDLVETFNYLLGLRVQRYDSFGQDGLLFVTGTDPDSRRVIVVWRDCDLWPNDRLEEKCRQAFESFRPDGFDVVYVNGDHHLPIIRTGEERWKVNLTEEAFHALMFDTSDVE